MRSQSIFYPTVNQAYWPFPLDSQRSRFLSKDRRSVIHLKNLFQTIRSKLSLSTEPQVWETRTAAGETVWSAEDTFSRRSIYNVSASDMRVWLEERYKF